MQKIWHIGICLAVIFAFGCKCSDYLRRESLSQAPNGIASHGHYSLRAFSNAFYLSITTMKEKNLLVFGDHLFVTVTNSVDGWTIRFSDDQRGDDSHALVFVANNSNTPPRCMLAITPERIAGGVRQWHFRRDDKFADAAMKALGLVLKRFTFATPAEFFISAHETEETLQFIFRFPPYETHMGVVAAVNSEGSPRIVRTGL